MSTNWLYQNPQRYSRGSENPNLFLHKFGISENKQASVWRWLFSIFEKVIENLRSLDDQLTFELLL